MALGQWITKENNLSYKHEASKQGMAKKYNFFSAPSFLLESAFYRLSFFLIFICIFKF